MTKTLFSSLMTRLLCIWLGLMTISGCGSRFIEVDALPSDINLSGKWQMVSEDKVAYQQFKRRAEDWTNQIMSELIARGQSKTFIEESRPRRMIMDVLVNLLSLPREELFFRQTPELLEVDYGVAGYHSFPLGQETEILLAGAEFNAIAGWQNNEIVLQILVTPEAQIYHRFRLMDDKNLIEIMEIELSENEVISHQRWYRREQ